MTLQEAIDLIRPGVQPVSGIWADIGAGTGMFTQALAESLKGSRGSGGSRGSRGSRGNRGIGGNGGYFDRLSARSIDALHWSGEDCIVIPKSRYGEKVRAVRRSSFAKATAD
jgi:hypothetical protein